MKYTHLVSFIFCFFLTFNIFGQRAGIVDSKLIISGVLNGERIAWEADVTEILIDKTTGEFKAFVSIDKFVMRDKPQDFEEGHEKGQHKYLEFTAQFPIYEALESKSRTVDMQVDMALDYNDNETNCLINFQLINLPDKGFTVLGQGTIYHKELEVEALKDLDEELNVIWSIIGI